MPLSIKSFDHIALSVSDIDRSIDFYEDVLLLQQIDRPAFQFPGAWFAFPGGQSLHLIGKEGHQGTRAHHFAVCIENQAEWIAHLQQHGVEFSGPKPRPDGIQQIFFTDPDGNLIELDYLDA